MLKLRTLALPDDGSYDPLTLTGGINGLHVMIPRVVTIFRPVHLGNDKYPRKRADTLIRADLNSKREQMAAVAYHPRFRASSSLPNEVFRPFGVTTTDNTEPLRCTY